MKPLSIFSGLAITAFLASPAWGHGTAEHSKSKAAVVKEQKPWGIAGDAKQAKRSIELRMSDDMRFAPNRIQVRQGETVRLVVVNTGKVLHELVIGSADELKAHAEMMKKFPNMEHDEPYMAHVDPGKRGEIIWTFNRPGEFEFACLIAGHFEAGMVGKIVVTAAASKTSAAVPATSAPAQASAHSTHKH
jgi:uncharacterized cupredoxin-like copper-binding protein